MKDLLNDFVNECAADSVNAKAEQGKIDFGDRSKSTQQKFEEFHEANPEVYERLRQGALRLRRRGWNHYGIWPLYLGLRYEHALQTTSDDSFKLNNNHTPHYARLLMKNEPELAGFFEIRILRNKPMHYPWEE